MATVIASDNAKEIASLYGLESIPERYWDRIAAAIEHAEMGTTPVKVTFTPCSPNHRKCSPAHARQVAAYREERARREAAESHFYAGTEELSDYREERPQVTFPEWVKMTRGEREVA